MKAILETISQTLIMLIKGAIEIIKLPCELLNISGYWAIVYTTVIAGISIIFGKKKR